MKKIYLLSIVLLFSLSSFSQTPDWANNISCIFFSHCTTCHHPNGIAPMSLLTFTDAATNASAILTQVQNKTMPPFLADVNYQQYAHQKTLTQEEISEITAWVNGGAPGGDTTLAPPAPTYTQGPVIANPDFTAAISTYTIPSLGNDMYRCFIISNPFPVDKYVTGFEVIPGDRAAVHHVLIYADDSNIPVFLDNLDSDPGYISFGGTGSNSSVLIGAFVPGSDPYFLPAGMGMKISAGSRIIVQVHYPISASGLTDSTRVNFQYSAATVREASDVPLLNHLTTITDGPLSIPADSIKTFHAQYTVPVDISVLSIGPHAHLVCTSMTSYAITPLGDTIPFETIPHWDFHWQGAYYFRKPVKIPAGTVLYGEATYDNTVNNPLNPNNPPVTVNLGEATTDEMMLFYFVYVLYQTGDEYIVVDTTSHSPHYLNCTSTVAGIPENSFMSDDVYVYPNPSSQLFHIDFPGNGNFSITIRDTEGRKICERKNLFGKTAFDSRNFSDGVYFIRAVSNTQKEYNKKLLILK